MSWSTVVDDEGAVRIRLSGYIEAQEGADAIAGVIALLGPVSRDLIFEVGELLGHRRAVRVAWQEALLPHRGQIRSLVVIGGSSVVRMSLSVMAMFLGLPISNQEWTVEADTPLRRGRPRSRGNLDGVTRPVTRTADGGSVTISRKRVESRPNY